jgi:hypothetical protein
MKYALKQIKSINGKVEPPDANQNDVPVNSQKTLIFRILSYNNKKIPERNYARLSLCYERNKVWQRAGTIKPVFYKMLKYEITVFFMKTKV